MRFWILTFLLAITLGSVSGGHTSAEATSGDELSASSTRLHHCCRIEAENTDRYRARTENRVRILLSLEVEELCVCQIIELLELAPSTVSKHMSVLRHARLVDSRKDGRWMYYRLADESANSVVSEAIAWVKKSLSPNERICEDARRLKEILKIDREVLCSQQARSSVSETDEK